MKYDDATLGVECALPIVPRSLSARARPGRARSLMRWLAMALRRWG